MEATFPFVTSFSFWRPWFRPNSRAIFLVIQRRAPTPRNSDPCHNDPTASTIAPAGSRSAPGDRAETLVQDAAGNTNSSVYVPLERQSHRRKTSTGLRGG